MDDETLIHRFLEFKELSQGRTPGTVNAYGAQLERLTEFLKSNRLGLRDVTHDELAQFVGLHLHKHGIAPRSRKLAVSAIRQLYTFLHNHGFVNTNPATRLEHPRFGRRLPMALQRRHVESIFQQTDLTTLKGIRDAAIIGVLAGCGLRVSGLVALNQGNVVTDTNERERDAAFLYVREKGGHERLVPLPDDALLLIRAYLGHPDLETINRELPDGDQVLFVNLRNRCVPPDEYYGEARRLRANAVREIFIDYGTRAGVPREFLHPHAARHLYGVELAEHEIDLNLRSALMGHRSPESTRLYERMSLRRLRSAVDRAGPLAGIVTPVSGLRDMLRR